MNALRTDRVRTLVFLKKREDITVEEFSRHWLDRHSKVILDVTAGTSGVIKYEQLHVNQAEKARLKKLGVPVLDFDGIALFDSETFDSLKSVFSSERYTQKAIPDELKFIDREKCVAVRLNIGSIVDSDEDLIVAAQMGSASSAYLQPPTKLRKDRSRVMFAFNAKEGVDLSKAWLQEHAEVVKSTPLGQTVIKYEQLHLTAPIRRLVSSKTSDSTLQLPSWDGLALIDVPTFDAFKDSKTRRMLAEDEAKWQVPGSMYMLPVDVATIIDKDVVPALLAKEMLSKL
ncbi:hypothetical protein V5O48_012726 [Marasmius crinis-equi]|uniref:EthD domain-containing protein n=1 Tax=Marasmius crinis-equi TaxID=585013 RepID=A0ABR3F206_9AGAR